MEIPNEETIKKLRKRGNELKTFHNSNYDPDFQKWKQDVENFLDSIDSVYKNDFLKIDFGKDMEDAGIVYGQNSSNVSVQLLFREGIEKTLEILNKIQKELLGDPRLCRNSSSLQMEKPKN